MNYIIKSAVIGDYGVGKTSIACRFVSGKFNISEFPTLGVDFMYKVIDFKENKYKIQIWDTAGQEKFESIVKSYIRDLNVCILVFDLNNSKSFRRAEEWYQEVLGLASDNIYICLVGNKKDLNLREVTESQINKFCSKNNLDYLECSAKEFDNINTIFINIVDKLDRMVKEGKINLRQYSEFDENTYRPKKERCCLIS